MQKEHTGRRRRNRQVAEEHTEQGKIVKSTQIVESTRIIDGHREEYELEVEKFITDPAFVRASVGMTRQLREYESVRVDIAVSLPCYKEQVEEVIQEATDMAIARCEEEIAYLLGEEVEERDD